MSRSSVILGVEVASHQIIEFRLIVPLVTSFDVGSPPRGSTAHRWAIQVTIRVEAGCDQKGAGTGDDVIRMSPEALGVTGIETMPVGELEAR